MKALQLAGRRFGRLAVFARGPMDRHGHYRWSCVCACGRRRLVAGKALVSGSTKSCGCLSTDTTRARNTTHGLSAIPEYQIWKAMIQRCANPRNKSFADYGGRGIVVCPRWSNFAAFLADMGRRPRGTMLDRRMNDVGYSPTNCRWVTPTVSTTNRRRPTHCKRGHLLAAPNLYANKSGRRVCADCFRAYSRRRYRRLHGLPERSTP